MERRKAIAIPFLMIQEEYYFLMVHDKRYREWTFVTGGCRHSENNETIKCAIRELEEESRGLIRIREGEYTSFSFKVRDLIDGITNNYDVYMLEYSAMTRNNQKRFMDDFENRKIMMDSDVIRFKKHYDENDFIGFYTLEEIKKLPNIWAMIRTEILENPKFSDALISKNKTTFLINDSSKG